MATFNSFFSILSKISDGISIRWFIQVCHFVICICEYNIWCWCNYGANLFTGITTNSSEYTIMNWFQYWTQMQTLPWNILFNTIFAYIIFFKTVLNFSAQSDIQTLHVHLPNHHHGFRMIRFDEASDVRQIINLVVSSMSPNQKTDAQCYALRLRHMLTREVSNLWDLATLKI